MDLSNNVSLLLSVKFKQQLSPIPQWDWKMTAKILLKISSAYTEVCDQILSVF